MSQAWYVAAGGFAGAVSRYLVSKYTARYWRGDFPLGTFLVNIAGSFLLGLLLLHPTPPVQLSPQLVTGLSAGFLGSFTTFSTLELESLQLLEKGRWRMAALYVAASFALGFSAAWLARDV
ncbi:MAG: fluoride efflux transporter CrcB [Desulfurispora sp.]|uniref:fluoride efflux transporter CrcB n=1 Tax=Desulfurispora sp. TaxID=3014275 RepID=UPI00404A09AA